MTPRKPPLPSILEFSTYFGGFVYRELSIEVSRCVAYSNAMKHRFLLHSLNHTILCVDISGIGISAGIISDSGETKTIPSIRFRTWSNAEQHFLTLGAENDTLRKIREQLDKQF